MMVFVIRIPTHLNDGQPVPLETMATVRQLVWDAFEGYTLGPVEDGAWADADGKVYEETTKAMQIATDRRRLSEAYELANEIGRLLDQKAMYVEVRYADGVEIFDVT